MSLACSYSIDVMNALASSSASHLSSSPKKTTNQYIPNHDPDSHFDESLKSYDTVDISNDSDIPPRPTSRLGFHDMGGSKSRSSCSRSRSATLKWTRSLFQKMGFDSSSSARLHNEPTQVPDTRATLVHDDEELESSLRNIPPSLSRDNLSLDDISFALSSGSDDDGDSDLSDSDFDLDSLSLSDLEDLREPCPPLPQTSITAIASSSFCTNPDTSASTPATPFSSHSTVSDEFEPSASIAQVPAIPEKYSSLPSPFSPSFTKSPRPVIPPTRHFYDNHGHSRHSLHHQKWFWSAREEAWAQYSAYVNSVGAYAGINTSPEQSVTSRFPLLFSSARITMPNSRRPWISESKVDGYPIYAQPELGVSAMDDSCSPSVPAAAPGPSPPQPLSPILVPLPPMTLHPRWGDVESLRDAWCVHMDRYFVGMPLWSIRKSLWMFDVHVLGMVSGKSAMGTKLSSVSRCQREHVHRDDGDDGVDDSTTDGGEEEEECCSSEDECGSMRMSMLTGLSDDSDITLVESDNESDGGDHDVEVEATTAGAGTGAHVDDAPVSGRSDVDFDGEEEFFEDVDLNDYGSFNSIPSSSSSSLRSSPMTVTTPTPSTSTSSSSLSYFATQSQSLSAHFSSAVERSPPQIHPSYTPLFLSSSSSSSRKCQNQNPNKHSKKNGSVIIPWETNWYKRSEVLLQLTRRDKELKVKVGEWKNKNGAGSREKRRKSDCGLEEEDVGGKRSIESMSIGLGISMAMSMSIKDEDEDPVTKALATSSHLKTVCAA